MDSKAEILSKCVDKQMDGLSSELKFISMVHFPTVAVVEAMDEWAKQLAIDFANWTQVNYWEHDDDQLWYKWLLRKETDINLTGEQLFELYLQSKQ